MIYGAMVAGWLLSGCFPAAEVEPQGNVRLSAIEMEPLTRATVTEVAERLTFFIYNADGEKVGAINQERGDAGFGQARLTLVDGEYTVVAVAHNGAGNATSSQVGQVKFPSNKVTDTFWASTPLTVQDTASATLTLTRRAARVVYRTTADRTEGAAQMKFYYTGGSSTLSGTEGYGAVNSRQTEVRALADDDTYEIYTLPHDEEDVIRLTVSALTDDGTVLTSQTYEQVPVRRGYETRLTVPFWTGESVGTSALGVMVDGTAWGVIDM